MASRDCKVLIVGNPCNTNALICMENAPRLHRRNFHALMRLDENRAKCQLAHKAQRFYTAITNLCVWGNHSTTQVHYIHHQASPPVSPACYMHAEGVLLEHPAWSSCKADWEISRPPSSQIPAADAGCPVHRCQTS